MIRTVIVIIWTVLATVVLSIATIVASFFSKTGNIPHLIAGIWGKSILWASRVKVTVRGLSSIDATQSYIFMVNHQSIYDIPVVLGHLPHQFRWLAKAELFRIPLFGHAMRRVGYISIDRSDREAAFKSLQTAADKIKDGVSVLIFPEGTRSQDGRIQPLKKGGFVLAVDSAVPIVPIVIRGTRAITPKNKLQMKPGQVSLNIKKPIESSKYSRKTKDALLEKVHRTFLDHFSGDI